MPVTHAEYLAGDVLGPGIDLFPVSVVPVSATERPEDRALP
jgi:hypothetical protein